MKLCINGKTDDVLYVLGSLMRSNTDLPLTMIIHPLRSEDYCVQIVTDMSLDDIAKIKDLTF